MTDDLVKRLRDAPQCYCYAGLDSDKIHEEAAARIEALEKEREQWFSADELGQSIDFARREALEEVEKLVKTRRVMGEPVEDLSEYGSGAYSECVAIIAAIRALKEK